MKPGVDRKVSEDLQRIARKLEDMLMDVAGEKVAFTLLVYTEPRSSYISNAPREDSVRELRSLLQLWDRGMPDVPAHKFG